MNCVPEILRLTYDQVCYHLSMYLSILRKPGPRVLTRCNVVTLSQSLACCQLNSELQTLPLDGHVIGERVETVRWCV